MARLNQVMAYVSSASSSKEYEVALEVDEFDRPKKWLTGPGKGMPRIMCGCMSMRNRTGVDDRGNCKHIRAVLDYTTGVKKWDQASAKLTVRDVEGAGVTRSWA